LLVKNFGQESPVFHHRGVITHELLSDFPRSAVAPSLQIKAHQCFAADVLIDASSLLEMALALLEIVRIHLRIGCHQPILDFCGRGFAPRSNLSLHLRVRQNAP